MKPKESTSDPCLPKVQQYSTASLLEAARAMEKAASSSSLHIEEVAAVLAIAAPNSPQRPTQLDDD